MLTLYKPGLPFNAYLKTFFRDNKKHGSKDRKKIASLCYNYFRLGFALKHIALEERILLASILCESEITGHFHFDNNKWKGIIDEQLKKKLADLFTKFLYQEIFPFKNALSDGVDAGKFSLSFLVQPKLFIRIRPEYKSSVFEKLTKHAISYEEISDQCIALSNSSKIDSVIELDKEAVVQDYNSQRVGELLKSAIGNKESKIKVWDCCAASGGKSIMAYDIKPGIQLTVSDKRESILENLKKRFARAGVKNYTSFVADLTNDHTALTDLAILRNKKVPTDNLYDIIIADVPCTGSGTWCRTPEQLFYFEEKQIKKYSDLQIKIVGNVLPFLKTGGFLLYVTCSVFHKENEDVVHFLTDRFKLEIIKMEIFKGYKMKADTLFAALLKMPEHNLTNEERTLSS